MATPTNLEVIQGATYNMQITWLSNQATPQPISLASYKAHMQIRRRQRSTAELFADLSSEVNSDPTSGQPPDITIEPSGQTGVILVKIPATVTVEITHDCWYDFFLVNRVDDTIAVRLLFGQITLDPSVTVN